MIDGIAHLELEDSLEALLARHSTRGGAVYVSTLALIAGAIVVLLTFSVDLTIRAPATLRPLSERQSLRAMSDGIVTRVAASRDGYVRKGDTLLVLGASAAEQAHVAALRAKDEQRAIASDLRILLRTDTSELPNAPRQLALGRSRAIAAEAAIEWRQLTIRVEQAARARDGLRQLAQRGFAAPAALDAAELELRHAVETRTLALEQHRVGWAGELAAAMQRISDLQRELAAEREARAAHAIVAPIAGAVGELASLSPGSAVRQGDVIATISPDETLAGEVLVTPRDIGWVRRGMPVRLLIEGYDVQEWGAADGVVTAVATDYIVVGDQPAFRVRVRLARPMLRRSDGRVVTLRKGLRCQARFLMSRRKLWQLLLHRARDWMDPSEPEGAAGSVAER